MIGRVASGIAIDAFVGDDERLERDYLLDQERMRCIRPEWRFGWSTEGAVGSRVAFWGPPEAVRPMLIDVVFDAGDGAVDAVLAGALAALGLDTIDYAPTRPVSGERTPRTE